MFLSPILKTKDRTASNKKIEFFQKLEHVPRKLLWMHAAAGFHVLMHGNNGSLEKSTSSTHYSQTIPACFVCWKVSSLDVGFIFLAWATQILPFSVLASKSKTRQRQKSPQLWRKHKTTTHTCYPFMSAGKHLSHKYNDLLHCASSRGDRQILCSVPK